MDTTKIANSPVMILKSFFGFKEGQTLKDFADEVKMLSENEKKELSELALIDLQKSPAPIQ